MELWVEDDSCVVLSTVRLNFSLAVRGHVLPPSHPEFFASLPVAALHDELVREYIGQFCPVAISAPDKLVLRVVVVAACEQVAEDELGDEDLMLLVDLHGDALAIVVDADEALLLVDLYLQLVHPAVPLVVVSSVDQHLVEYFEEGGDAGDFLVCELEVVLLDDPLV